MGLFILISVVIATGRLLLDQHWLPKYQCCAATGILNWDYPPLIVWACHWETGSVFTKITFCWNQP